DNSRLLEYDALILKNKQDISVVISGSAAVGKTTLAHALAKEFGFKLYNGGDILKEIARQQGYSVTGNDWWDSNEAIGFMKERKKNSIYDRQVDEKLTNIAKKGNVIITSQTLPWLTPEPITFWLSASPQKRSERMSKRDKISIKEALRIVRMRDRENKKIYKKIYGIKFGDGLEVFDFMINTELLSLDSLVYLCKEIMKKMKIQ
ncbi:MAG TPA: cytidylate kinase family protein, partial [Nitrososphaeraceae archaeon]|nr:cytidylate kinase family protein [Nitrososphaeraceae archaeon]